MERFAIKIDKKLKANLYKICRLCGMDNQMEMIPILTHDAREEQPPVDVDAEPEMCQKIHLLIGLSVTKDDKMPQTMCCLCVDKINDFYEFREMCYATNTQTRKLLGLKTIKKSLVDIKPKIEIKEESIVPNAIASTPSNKNGNRKRKSDEVALKEEPATPVFIKKKLRFSAPDPPEPPVKEEVPVSVSIKKKLRFSSIEEPPSKKEPTTISKKSKKNETAPIEEPPLKKEPSPPLPAVSNKKLRLAAAALKEAATKKSKKGGKSNELKNLEVKEEIKEEIKEEPVPVPVPAPPPVVPSTPKLKHGCTICKERFVTKVKLEAHVRTAHLPKIERFVCTACSEVLSKGFDIKNHQLWHKLSKTPYICGCCGESILNTYAYTRHLREHAFETPPALMVLDRECPQCHTSHATNFLYNTHPCAVKTKRCAGCNRLQRTEAEYMKHSAQCAKVYLNYSKHIMPTVEALEDAVRIKNENDVEAAAEEMARLTGVSLDMAPVVQLTRLSSPFILAANQCVVIPPGLDEAASASNKKSGKKGASKKDFRRVDELLKSTLDALVSIKHEPEVHVEPETPAAGEHSDNDDMDMGERHDDGLDDFHHNDDDDDSDYNENKDQANQSSNVCEVAETAEQIKIKQESEDAMNEENSNKVVGGLKLKIRKEHGQLNSSIIEQQKSTEKRAEKRKKKKKHKDKEKDKQKHQDEQISQDSNTNAEENTSTDVNTTIRIKTEPQDAGGDVDLSAAPLQPIRPQPEATIMTSIPMMQFQIACVSSGVEFTAPSEAPPAPAQTQAQAVHSSEPEDVKPNRQELDRILKISHVTSGIQMQINETEKVQEVEEDHQKEHYDTDHHTDDNQSDLYENNQSDPQDHDHDHDDDGDDHDHDDDDGDDHDDDDGDYHETETETERENAMDIDVDNETTVKKIKKRTLKPKPTIKPKLKPPQTVPVTKSRNKACKSTAKPPSMPVLQISAIQSGVALPLVNDTTVNEFTPIFIKPEPQNRGYADEESPPISSKTQGEEEEQDENNIALPPSQVNPEEEDYISSIDFNNITVKQEKDIEICDVQISRKPSVSSSDINGIKRKRKQYQRRQVVKDGPLEEEKMENDGDNIEDEGLEVQDQDEATDEEAEEEDEEDEEDVEEEEDEEEDEEEEHEEEEEREYRELEYPPELTQNIPKITDEISNEQEETNKESNDEKDKETNLLEKEVEIGIDVLSKPHVNENENGTDNANETLQIEALPPQTSFVIASVCSQAIDSTLLPNENSENASNDETIQIETNEDQCNNLKQSTNDNLDTSSNQPSSHLNQDSTLAPSTIDSYSNHNPDLDSATISLNNSNIAEHVKDCDLALNLDHTLTPSNETPILEQPSTHLTHNEINLSNIPFEGDVMTTSTDNVDQLHENTLKILATPEIQETLNDSEAVTHLDENVATKIGDNDLEGANPQSQILDTRAEELPCIGQETQDKLGESSHNQNVLHHGRELQNISQEDLLHSQQQSQSDQYFTEKPQYSGKELLQTADCFGQHIETSQEVEPPVLHIPSIASDFSVLTTNPSNEETHLDITQEQSTTIEGVVEQAKDIQLDAQPFVEATPPPPHTPILNNDQNMVNDDDGEEEDDEDEDDDEEINEEEDATLDINLEEQQNHHNQEVFSQTRPAALALHPYLEDISSSSNSFLSNTLSQTPPPPPTASVLNTSSSSSSLIRPTYNEETENILNESNDVLLSRSSEVVAVVPPIPQLPQLPQLPRHLPLQMPTFNFDNINEIAENNNNANIEREQLQDEQQQQQQQQQQQHQPDHVT